MEESFEKFFNIFQAIPTGNPDEILEEISAGIPPEIFSINVPGVPPGPPPEIPPGIHSKIHLRISSEIPSGFFQEIPS